MECKESYRAGSLRTVARESIKYKLNLMRIMNYGQAFSYIMESYQQLRG
jgi:hypothetical protein